MGAYVHMYTKYEVSMSNPVAGGAVHRQHQRCQRRTKHDCIGPLANKPNEPIKLYELVEPV